MRETENYVTMESPWGLHFIPAIALTLTTGAHPVGNPEDYELIDDLGVLRNPAYLPKGPSTPVFRCLTFYSPMNRSVELTNRLTRVAEVTEVGRNETYVFIQSIFPPHPVIAWTHSSASARSKLRVSVAISTFFRG